MPVTVAAGFLTVFDHFSMANREPKPKDDKGTYYILHTKYQLQNKLNATAYSA